VIGRLDPASPDHSLSLVNHTDADRRFRHERGVHQCSGSTTMICSSGWSAMALHSRCLALMMVRLRLLHVIDKCSFNCSGRDYLCDETPEKNDELAHRGRLSKNKKQTPPPWMVWTLMRQLECGIACPSPRERATNHKTVTVSSSNLSACHSRKSMNGRNDFYVQACRGNDGMMMICMMILPPSTNYGRIHAALAAVVTVAIVQSTIR
jgi:hypothetical protein